MNRRSFFGLFAALPFIGPAIAKEPATTVIEFDSQLTGKIWIGHIDDVATWDLPTKNVAVSYRQIPNRPGWLIFQTVPPWTKP